MGLPTNVTLLTLANSFLNPVLTLQWTPDGDAFVIGSNIQRLESETLPHYFRHNRFQSLVRQLNFYSFRKINRERNVWIYKHELFHRDRPDDLHLVRRRTCPGMDGRKHRFSSRRFSVGTSAGTVTSMDNSKDADDYSVDSSSSDGVNSPPTPVPEEDVSRKRSAEVLTSWKTPSVKCQRKILDQSPSTEILVDESVVVDTSLLQEIKKETVIENEEAVEQASLSLARPERIELAEQSLVVSQVAMKLDQYARKARKSASRTRSGIVTPPYGGPSSTISPGSLLTYDDEFDYDSDDNLIDITDNSSTDESLVISEERPHSLGLALAPLPRENKAGLTVIPAPILDCNTARLIASRLLQRCVGHQTASLIAAASVAGFCMSTSPYSDDKELCSKILHLISSCDQLCGEFQLYRSALRPRCDQGEIISPKHGFSVRSTLSRNVQAVTMRQIWEREASRGDAVRDFKTFAVNCVNKLLGKSIRCEIDAYPSLTKDLELLGRTANVWLTSAGAAA